MGGRQAIKRKSGIIAKALGGGRCAAHNESGAAAVEFGLVMPMLLMVLLGIIQFGMTINNYLELTDAVRSGARALAIGRSSSTPYTTAISAINTSAANLTSSGITKTLTVNGSTCTSDSQCATDLATAAGKSATVTATYSCSLTVMGVNFASGCQLSSTTTDLIE